MVNALLRLTIKLLVVVLSRAEALSSHRQYTGHRLPRPVYCGGDEVGDASRSDMRHPPDGLGYDPPHYLHTGDR